MSNSPKQKPGAQPTQNTGALEAIALRNDFYQDGYRSAQTTNVLLAVGFLLSVALNFYQASRPPLSPKYFATTPSGAILPMTPLDNPLLNTNQLGNWVTNAVTKAYTLDAKNYVKQINENARYFTREGFEQYKQALLESQQLKLIKDEVMITSAVSNGAPVIINAMRTREGTLMWRMQMPMTVQYSSAKKSYVQNVMINLVVSRVETHEYPDGVAITQMVSRPASR